MNAPPPRDREKTTKKCCWCKTPLIVGAIATLTPGPDWKATYCPKCDRRQCSLCGTSQQRIDGKTCENPACGQAL